MKDFDLLGEAPPLPSTRKDNGFTHQDGVRRHLVIISSYITATIFGLIALGLCFGLIEEVKIFSSIVLGPWIPMYSSMLTYYFVKSS